MSKKMNEKKIKIIVEDYLKGLSNTYYVLDELGFPTSTELYELLYLFKDNNTYSKETVDNLTKIILSFIEEQW